MNVTKKIAEQINQDLHQGYTGYGFDPTIIMTIITAIFQVLQNCGLNTDGSRARAMRRRRNGELRFLDRFIVRNIIRQHSGGDVVALESALLDACDTCSASDWKSMHEEAKQPTPIG